MGKTLLSTTSKSCNFSSLLFWRTLSFWVWNARGGGCQFRTCFKQKNTFFLGLGGFPYHNHQWNCITCVTRDTALLQFLDINKFFPIELLARLKQHIMRKGANSSSVASDPLCDSNLCRTSATRAVDLRAIYKVLAISCSGYGFSRWP